jgi:DNA-directed RNA polymerase I, II, and III subunit RPABC1
MVALKQWIAQIRVLEDMMHDRGYTNVRVVSQGQDLLHLCTALDSKGDSIHVYITEENKVGVKTLRRIREECKKSRCMFVIIICPFGLTPFALKEMSNDDEGQSRIDVFKKAELSFNVTKHSLVPAHVPLSPADKRKLLTRLGSKATSLPKIKTDDPVIHYLGLQPGTVVSIKRTFGGLETESYYRMVV